jgi:hypothetical protein
MLAPYGSMAAAVQRCNTAPLLLSQWEKGLGDEGGLHPSPACVRTMGEALAVWASYPEASVPSA